MAINDESPRRGVACNAHTMYDTQMTSKSRNVVMLGDSVVLGDDAAVGVGTIAGVARNAPTRYSVRLKGYDYSQNGLYFVTICVQNHKCLFGNIRDGLVSLNYAGKIAEHELIEMPKHRRYVILKEHIIMPNHIHMIVEITDCRSVACNAHNTNNTHHTNNAQVPDNNPAPMVAKSPRRGVACNAHKTYDTQTTSKSRNVVMSGDGILLGDGAAVGVGPAAGVARNAPTVQNMSAISPKHGTLSVIVRAYKSAVSRRMGYSPWQRNYYEHIIRNEQSYNEITEYIRNNPKRWQTDKLYMKE